MHFNYMNKIHIKYLLRCSREKKPLNYIQHPVQRDLDLVANIGAITNNDLLSVNAKETAFHSACTKLPALNKTGNDEWIIFHPGVSEEKKKISHAYVDRAWRND